ncbi:MAG: TonB-dependent receptor [Flavobacteriaceae bacterium]|nr:TonB-dependent receptor [Flavobacteriaceae bacterium]
MLAQEVTVVDFETKFPIKNCTIYGENNPKTVHTDKNGKADVSVFADNEIITINHISYIEVEVLKRKLSETKHTIYLHRNAEALDEIVLSSSRKKELRKRIAEHVEINQLAEIRRIAPQTSADLLASIPGIKVQKSQFGGGSPVLRGMEANRILLVVDGVRMNNAIYRSGHLQSSITVSPSILERAEVIFGPSSVIYGSDALGGVIHYYTKTPKINQEEKVKFNLLSRYSSVNEEYTNQGSVELSFKKWASLTSFSHSEFDDLRMGKNRSHGFDDWGKVFKYSDNTNDFYNLNPIQNTNPNIQKNTGYNQSDFLQKFYFKLSSKTDLTVNFQNSTSSDIPRFDRLTEYSDGNLKFAEWYYGPQKRLLVSAQLAIHPHKKWIDDGTITVAYQKIKESRIQRKFNNLERLYRQENVDVFSLNGDFSIQLAKASNRDLSYGFEVAHNKVGSNSFGKTIEINGNEIIGFSDDFTVQSRYPDGGSTYTSSAVYTNYRQDVAENATLNTGIRFTHTILNAKWIDETFISLPDNDITLKNSSLTATVGYTFRPTKEWRLSSVLSSGFRSPNIDDVGKIREKNGKVTVPNVNLRPEYVYNAEIGVLKYFNNKKFNIGLNAYYTLLNNYISRENFMIDGGSTILYDNEIVETIANVNHKNAYIIGGTLSFKGKLKENWKTKGSVTYTKGKTYDTDTPLSSIPPLFGNVEVSYAKNRFETALNFKFNNAKKLKDYNLVEGIDNIEQTPYNNLTSQYYGTPSWKILNFYSKYKVSNTVQFQFMIDNIFDQHYKEFASAISAPGRNFSFSILIN